MTEIFLEILGSLIGNIHHLIIFIGCFYFLIKIKNKISITLFLGSLIILLTSILNRALMGNFISNNSDQIMDINDFLKLTNGLIFFGYLIFSIGFLLLIREMIKKTQ